MIRFSIRENPRHPRFIQDRNEFATECLTTSVGFCYIHLTY